MKPAGKISDSVAGLHGVGPKRLELLGKLGIRTVEDLLCHLPVRYEDRTIIRTISDLAEGEVHTIEGEVLDVKLRRTGQRKFLVTAEIGDGSDVIEALWFNQPFIRNTVHDGDRIVVTGTVQTTRGLQILVKDYEVLGDQPPRHAGRLLPIYPLTENLSPKILRNLIRQAVEDYADQMPEIFPEAFRRRRHLPAAPKAIRAAHFPQDRREEEAARRRLVYEEFFLMQLALAREREATKAEPGIAFQMTPELDGHIRRLFPFALTDDQNRVIEEIGADLASTRPMNRLLQGDVGSGKTAVAAYALLTAVANKYQAAIMAPTEILAEQHFIRFRHLLSGSRVRMVLLSGKLKGKSREESLQLVRDGKVDLVVGTHAVIQEAVAFRKLGLVVIDEQHKFGVIQRAALRAKGARPDVLVMTATPIPRTLTLTVFGDLSVSVIRKLPPGRRPVKTHFVEARRRKDAYEFIRKQLRQGRQAYVVYPLVEESPKLDLRAAKEMAKHWQEKIVPAFRVGLLHGRLKPEEKDEVMEAFRSGRNQVLVCTVVIEVGIDVPNATLLVIEHAERFGLAQLHQLRGRVGRGAEQSYCLLFGSRRSETARQRLAILTETTDGFRIAEEDWRLRGPGEMFGTRQHGMLPLRMGDLVRDLPILEEARRDAFALIAEDPDLAAPPHVRIRERLREKLAGLAELARIG